MIEFGAKNGNAEINSIWYGPHTISDFILNHIDFLLIGYEKRTKDALEENRVCGRVGGARPDLNDHF